MTRSRSVLDGATSSRATLVAKAEELGREAGKAAASWVFDGNTPEVLCT
jgi:hypothetical protein